MEEKYKEGRLRCGTYNDGDAGGSAQDLLHQAVSVVQGLHDLPLALGDLKGRKQRHLVSVSFTSFGLPLSNLLQHYRALPDN